MSYLGAAVRLMLVDRLRNDNIDKSFGKNARENSRHKLWKGGIDEETYCTIRWYGHVRRMLEKIAKEVQYSDIKVMYMVHTVGEDQGGAVHRESGWGCERFEGAK